MIQKVLPTIFFLCLVPLNIGFYEWEQRHRLMLSNSISLIQDTIIMALELSFLSKAKASRLSLILSIVVTQMAEVLTCSLCNYLLDMVSVASRLASLIMLSI